MPSSIRVGSRTTLTPGVYTQVDASALNAPSPTAVGIVALIGEAVGGKPYTAIATRDDIPFYSTVGQLARDYAVGDLLEAGNIAFGPSTVTGGAQQIVPLKVNPSTQAHLTLQGTSGPVLALTAQAYGLSGNGITVQVGPGSSRGLKLTITQGATVETGDNLGDDPVATLTYDPSVGWAQLKLAKDDTALTLSGLSPVTAATGQLQTTTLAAEGPITVVGAAGDAGKKLTLYGATAAGAAVVEQLTITGSPQPTTNRFARLLGAQLSDTATQIQLQDGSGNALGTLGANQQQIGMRQVGPLAVANGPVQVTSPAAGQALVVVGTSITGAAIAAVVTTQAATAVATTAAFARVTAVAAGGLSQDVQLAATAARVPCAGQTTLQAAAGALRAVPGLTARVTRGDETTPLAGLDSIPATALGSDPLTLVSDLEAVVDWVGDNSLLVTAAAVPGAATAPSVTAQPVVLAGGSESPASAADYQACLNLLKQVRVNIVVPLTSDPAVHAMAEAHCSYMSGAGQSERICHLGAQNPALTKPASRSQAKLLAKNLNSAYALLTPNGIVRYDTQGNLTEFPPHVTAAALAGMRAGARVCTPLTRKGLAVVGFTQDPSYDPVADSDDMIAAGLTFLRRFDSVGVAPVRDVTTWLRDSNPVYSATMVAYATGINVYTYRTALEQFVGQDGFDGGFNQIKVFAVQVLGQLRDAKQIYDFDPPTGTRVGDAIYIDQTWQYDPETNFILPTIRLINPQQAAA